MRDDRDALGAKASSGHGIGRPIRRCISLANQPAETARGISIEPHGLDPETRRLISGQMALCQRRCLRLGQRFFRIQLVALLPFLLALLLPMELLRRIQR
ncbi:hypothetical protein [Corticibacter populi]|uniref:hypothetical protein n=1 Tax=Corticibacter populi TaxID=1550736 RepID=UPI001F5F4BEE|nr:hypothetical protein [Corticibacter populi]